MHTALKIVGTVTILSTIGLIAYFNSQEYPQQGSFLQLVPNKIDTFETEFDKFIPKFSKNYKDKNEYNQRKSAFANNWAAVQQLKEKAKTRGFKVELNQFADFTKEEFDSILKFDLSSALEYQQLKSDYQKKVKKSDDSPNTPPAPEKPDPLPIPETPENKSDNAVVNNKTDNQSDSDVNVSVAPQIISTSPTVTVIYDSVDWRQSGSVTPVKNQGRCGSCYSFASTGAIEGIYKIKKGQLIEFSTQQAVDCSTRNGNSGCNGGNMENTFTYFKQKKIQNSTTYPYTGVQKSCSYNQQYGIINTLGYGYAKINDPTSMIAQLKIQPLAVAIDASLQSFMFYSSGIYSDENCSSQVNHAVLLIGYGSDSDGTPFWIVKNSWGTTWGEAGYFRIKRDTVTGKTGICGINQFVVFPKI